MQAATKALPIVGLIAGLSTFYGKNYCYPSQKWILAKLGERLGLFISIATLNRYLRVLEDNGYIERTRRIKRHPVKGLLFQSTMYTVLKKGLWLLENLGVMIFDKIRRFVNGFKDEAKKPAPDPEQVFLVPKGKSYAVWLAEGGERPSIK